MLRPRPFEHTVVRGKADLEGIFIFVAFLLILSNQAWGHDKRPSLHVSYYQRNVARATEDYVKSTKT